MLGARGGAHRPRSVPPWGGCRGALAAGRRPARVPARASRGASVPRLNVYVTAGDAGCEGLVERLRAVQFALSVPLAVWPVDETHVFGRDTPAVTLTHEGSREVHGETESGVLETALNRPPPKMAAERCVGLINDQVRVILEDTHEAGMGEAADADGVLASAASAVGTVDGWKILRHASGLWQGVAVPDPAYRSEVPVNPIHWSLSLVEAEDGATAGLAFGGGVLVDAADVPGCPVLHYHLEGTWDLPRTVRLTKRYMLPVQDAHEVVYTGTLQLVPDQVSARLTPVLRGTWVNNESGITGTFEASRKDPLDAF